MWRFVRNELLAAWRTWCVPLLLGFAVLAITASFEIQHRVPRLYMSQSERAARLCAVAAQRAHTSPSQAERLFFAREAAWYRQQSRDIYWRAVRYALRPGYGPNGEDEQSDVALTIRDLANRERLDQHGFGWSRYQWLAEEHARAAEERKGWLDYSREQGWELSPSDREELLRDIAWHRRMEQVYLSAAARPWAAVPEERPRP